MIDALGDGEAVPYAGVSAGNKRHQVSIDARKPIHSIGNIIPSLRSTILLPSNIQQDEGRHLRVPEFVRVFSLYFSTAIQQSNRDEHQITFGHPVAINRERVSPSHLTATPKYGYRT